MLSLNILIYLSGKPARRNLNDYARSEKEIESLIPKEGERPWTGVYLDSLSHWAFHNGIWPFWFAKKGGKPALCMEQFSEKIISCDIV